MAQFIMRINKTPKMLDEYDNKYIMFSCPANWINYYELYGNDSIGDGYECSYAHLIKGDPRIKEFDCYGKSMQNNIIEKSDKKNNNAVYLIHEAVALTPALCFYQTDITQMAKCNDNRYSIDLREFAHNIGYNYDESSLMIIYNSKAFENDLKASIPLAVYNSENLVIDGSDGYYDAFNENTPMDYQPVDYEHHKIDDYFYEKNGFKYEMWWKDSRFQYQNEGRITIPHVHFKQHYRGNNDNYDYRKNYLKVPLEQLHTYSKIIDLRKQEKINFFIKNGTTYFIE